MRIQALLGALVLLPLAACDHGLNPASPPGDAAGPGFTRPGMSELLRRGALTPAEAPAEWRANAALDAAASPAANGPTHIVLQNVNTGLRVGWDMERTTFTGSVDISTQPTEWSIVAAADFTGDGKPDLVWQRRSTGDQVIWHMDGFRWTGTQTSLPLVDPRWWIVGAGDFTGDGQPDLVWQNRSAGRQVIWHMNGAAWSGAQNELAVVDPRWWIAGVGDFTGDGRPDLLWQDQGAGRQTIWHMNGATWGGAQNELTQVTPGWHVAGAGDFNADGGADVLWQRPATGEQVVWLMNGTQWNGTQASLMSVPAGWRIATPFPARAGTTVRAPAEALHPTSYTAFRRPPYGMMAATPWLAFVHTGAAGVASWAEIDHIELWAEIDGVSRRVAHNLYDDTNYGGQLRTRNPWFDSNIETPMPVTGRGSGVLVIRPGDRPEKVWHPFLGSYPAPRADLSRATRVWFVSRVRLHGPVAVQGGIDYYEKLSGYEPEVNRLEEGAATDWEYTREQWIDLTMEPSTEVASPIALSAPSADGTYPAGQPITATFTLRNADDDPIRLAEAGIDTRLVLSDPYCRPVAENRVESFGWAANVELAPGGTFTHTSTWTPTRAGDYCIRVVEQRSGVRHRTGAEAGQPLYQQPYAGFPVRVIRVK